MKSKINLRNISLYISFGIVVILIGFLILSSRKDFETNIQEVQQEKSSPEAYFLAKVVRIVDGDTIEIGTGQKVRYIGINTPEIENSECFANEAKEINSNLVLGKNVRLEKDVSDVDKYGRLLRYVYIDGEMVNDALVRDGFAKIETVSPDIKHKQEFLDSEKYAMTNKVGLWRVCN